MRKSRRNKRIQHDPACAGRQDSSPAIGLVEVTELFTMREIASVEEQAKPAFDFVFSEVTDFFTIDGNGPRWGTSANSSLRCSTTELHRHLEPTTGFEPMTTRLSNEVTVHYTTNAKREI